MNLTPPSSSALFPLETHQEIVLRELAAPLGAASEPKVCFLIVFLVLLLLRLLLPLLLIHVGQSDPSPLIKKQGHLARQPASGSPAGQSWSAWDKSGSRQAPSGACRSQKE